jgi:FAD/FMN-containing dehydrogenase
MASSAACEALSAALGNSKVFGPDHAAFVESTTSYFSAFENELTPACVVRPGSKEDVSTIVKAFKPFAARGEQLAIRGGGHMSGPGSANIANGITIDMRGLTGIEVSEDQNVARIAAGEHWAGVYEKLHSLGLGVSGGRAAKVGVGGFILGGLLSRRLHRAVFVTDWRNAGGLSLFSTRRGFVCDSVVNFEVVLASGDIVNANSTENKDLWLALRGGGNNFGIVTRFDMSVFPQGEMWGGSIIYDISSSPQLFQALYNFVVDPAHDTATHFIWSGGIAQGFKAAMSNM